MQPQTIVSLLTTEGLIKQLYCSAAARWGVVHVPIQSIHSASSFVHVNPFMVAICVSVMHLQKSGVPPYSIILDDSISGKRVYMYWFPH